MQPVKYIRNFYRLIKLSYFVKSADYSLCLKKIKMEKYKSEVKRKQLD